MDWRQYDPAIARWISMDPVIHHSMSPYNAFDNNPVFWKDPSGANSEAINWLYGVFGNSQNGDIWTNNGEGIFINNRTGQESKAPQNAYLSISLGQEFNFRPDNMAFFRNYVKSIKINGGIDDLINALEKALGLKLSEINGVSIELTNKRIIFLAIFSHGFENTIFGDGSNINKTDLIKLKELVEAGGFHSDSVIYLGGCNAGTGGTNSFAQELANITGATVIAMKDDGVAPTGNERTTKTMTYGPKYGAKYNGNFYKFNKGTTPTLIGSSIDVIQLLDTQRKIDPINN